MELARALEIHPVCRYSSISIDRNQVHPAEAELPTGVTGGPVSFDTRFTYPRHVRFPLCRPDLPRGNGRVRRVTARNATDPSVRQNKPAANNTTAAT